MKQLIQHNRLCFLLLLGSIIGCTKPPSVSFRPPDDRPIGSVAVADAGEAELLKQQLGLEILRVESNVVYYHDQPGMADRLKSFGYTVKPVLRPEQFYNKIVRLIPSKTGAALPGGENDRPLVKLLRREKGYLVVNGSLAELERLSKMGWKVVAQPGEVFPRLIEVNAKNRGEVDFIVNNISDVISVKEQKDLSFLVNGSAFDYQLEELDKRQVPYKLLE